MFRVRADHPHHTLAADDLAVLTNTLHAGSHFHDSSFNSILPFGICLGGGRIGLYSKTSTGAQVHHLTSTPPPPEHARPSTHPPPSRSQPPYAQNALPVADPPSPPSTHRSAIPHPAAPSPAP